jgi:hypothetical protein
MCTWPRHLQVTSVHLLATAPCGSRSLSGCLSLSYSNAFLTRCTKSPQPPTAGPPSLSLLRVSCEYSQTCPVCNPRTGRSSERQLHHSQVPSDWPICKLVSPGRQPFLSMFSQLVRMEALALHLAETFQGGQKYSRYIRPRILKRL